MAELTLISNPIAGNGKAAAAHEQVAAALHARGIAFSDAVTDAPGHATELAKAAVQSGCRRVIVLGGDGTLREAAMGLAGTDCVLGIIPCGTGNDTVRPLHIPADDPLKALEIALNGRVRKMDGGMANDLPFFNVAGFGFDVDVLQETEKFKYRVKNGSLAYFMGLLSAVRGFTLRKTHLTWDGNEADMNVLIIAAGNGTHFGGGMNIAPLADPFDGKLDVCIIHDVKKKDVPLLMSKFLKGRHLDSPFVTYFKTEQLTAECEPVSAIQVEGEIMPSTPVTFRILPERLCVAVPE